MSALFQIVVSNIFVASLIAILAWQIGRSGRRAKAAHLLWLLVYIKLITPPIVPLHVSIPADWLPQPIAHNVATDTFATNPTTASQPTKTAEKPVSEMAVPAVEPQVPSRFSVPSWLNWAMIAGAIWFVGGAVVLLRSLVRYLRFQKLLREEGIYDQDATEQVRKLLCGSDHDRQWITTPSVLRVPVRVSPMLFGFGRSTAIVCPDELWQSLGKNERNSMLAHEAGHYRRRDHWVRWLQLIVNAAYWWFPIVYWAKGQIERHEEACCDAWAVGNVEVSPRRYAESLLKVVDFISDNDIGKARLASAMHPTESLEERIRLLMRPSAFAEAITPLHSCVGATCLMMWALHPIPVSSQPKRVVIAEQRLLPESFEEDDSDSVEPVSVVPEILLPDSPTGYWNQSPAAQWADFSLALEGAWLNATSGDGIQIRVPGREVIQFSREEITSIVEVPATKRVVIGNQKGQVRLWDLIAGAAVSLIGQHTAEVTSMTFHDASGLVSADTTGSLMRWDLQSGDVLATWSPNQTGNASNNPPVQSVRHSIDGRLVAVLTGDWSGRPTNRTLHFLNSDSLESIADVSIKRDVAVVVEHEGVGWVAIDWVGNVWSLETDSILFKIDKAQVSALVFSEIALLNPYTSNTSENR